MVWVSFCIMHSVLLSFIFFPCSQAASYVALGLIYVKNSTYLSVESGVILPQALGQVFVDGGFGNAKVAGGCPNGGIGFQYVHSQITGALLQVLFHRLPSDAVLLGKLMRQTGKV